MLETDIRVIELNIYPVKSCRGIALRSADAGPRGFLRDREWMIVDGDGEFVTQRECPKLALVETSLGGDHLGLSAAGHGSIRVPLDLAGPVADSVVWDSVVSTIDQGDEAAGWLSEWLGVECRLVRHHPGHVRPVDPNYEVHAGDQVSLADGYPFLLIGAASLADLNSRMAIPLPMNRFRPSIVVEGSAPFAEDGWRRFAIGDLTFTAVKPCARCATTQVDQATGKIGKEPLATLAKFRNVNQKVYFGQNLIHDGPGTVRVGDRVEQLAVLQ